MAESLLMSENRFPNNLPPEWRRLLAPEAEKPYFRELTSFLQREFRRNKKIFPNRNQILRALQSVDYPDVKVVILGQDPYPGEGHAIGLCFGVPNEVQPKPPSLVNIFKEIESDCGRRIKSDATELSGWANQGVLLLNAVLTLEAGKPFSHQGRGWERFTDRIIELLAAREEPIVFLLWGSAAQKKAAHIDPHKHLILKSAHPSPLSAYRGFFGCKHFSRTNEFLESRGMPPIRWEQTL